MFDSYNYVKNNVIKNLKKYKYYVCVQDYLTMQQMQNNPTNNDVVCYYTTNNNAYIDNTTLKNFKNDDGKGYMCSFNLNYKNNQAPKRSIECSNFSNWTGEVTVSFSISDYVYTNIDNTIYSSILEEIPTTKQDSLNINQDVLYLIPFSMILVVLALWWFRK